VIPVRFHVISLVAVLLALAAGIALGGGPLSDLGRNDAAAATTSRADKAAYAAASSAAGFGDEVVESSAPRLYDGALESRPVAIVAFPGVSDETLTAVSDQVKAAGGAVSGRYTLTKALVNPGEKALVDTLGSQLLTQLEKQDLGASLTADAPTYERAGELLGVAVGTRQTDKKVAIGAQGASVLQTFAGAELVTGGDQATTRAPDVLVLLGKDTDAEQDPIYEGLLTGLSRQAAAVTVASDATDGVDGRLARLRETPVAAAVATVDGVDRATGQVTAVLALAQWPTTKGGSFGASGSDGAVPLG
jgi:Copper transport outer membrane protein, MctB